MVINLASCCCMPFSTFPPPPPPPPSSLSRSILRVPNSKLDFYDDARSLRLVSVRAQFSSTDGLGGGHERWVRLDYLDTSIGLSSSLASSVIDFLTLCRRLKLL
ncbi:hypothetical protein PIB30_043167 [Stylosanthes scabra]|uniref:Uncharacterized protein n=1 Tax=Stylosanthes scabra TaxID=79078 RepID=A0ABU6SFD0_9FABA|nr:hypothetical protein [Stylosanthes scabra]